jgi:hypothetical protein
MGAVVKQGLKGSSLISSNVRKTTSSGDNNKISYGKVYGVVNGINLPTPEMYQKVGGRLGTIFYLNADASKNKDGIPFNTPFLDKCLIANAYEPNIQYYPLVGEIVELKQAPSIDSQNAVNNSIPSLYWSRVINLLGDSQQNAQLTNQNASLGKTFVESDNKNLVSYEGDYILSGRKGNSIRFTSITGLYSSPNTINFNEWSSVGKEGNPLIIFSNGHNYASTPSALYVEQINKDASSIYLTSTQTLPIEIDSTGLKSPLIGEPIAPEKYNDPQVILNADRILINSKKDEIMLFSKTNTIIKGNGINLVGNSIQLTSNEVYLGNNGNDLPDEPVLLGFKVIELLSDLVEAIQTFSTNASPAVDSMGVPIAALKVAADRLNADLEKVKDRFKSENTNEYIASNKVFVS